MDNFNAPFKATSIADFWRRWHISLSKWLLDYLFKPMQIKFRNLKMYSNVLSLFVTFLICGLWHGAGWNFILWGALHGFYMSVGVLLQKPKIYIYKKLRIQNTLFLKIVQGVVTFHLIAFSFLIFRFSDLSKVKAVLIQIFTYFHGEIYLQFVEKLPLISALIITGFLFHFTPVKAEEKIKTIIGNMPLAGKVMLLVVVIYIVAQFKSANPLFPSYFQY
jgi:D-alanyl-lipoteichoic acid acyltransferase DltB (MBOAT superfamily)